MISRDMLRVLEKLNSFVRWFSRPEAGRSQSAADYLSLMRRLRYVEAGRRFTRDKMNPR